MTTEDFDQMHELKSFWDKPLTYRLAFVKRIFGVAQDADFMIQGSNVFQLVTNDCLFFRRRKQFRFVGRVDEIVQFVHREFSQDAVPISFADLQLFGEFEKLLGAACHVD
ncbi:unnamed protein product, partial [Nesidiocoris tenuis]